MAPTSHYGQRYALRRELGAGRLGEVHESLHGEGFFERVVAIKRLTALTRDHALAWRIFEEDVRRAAMLTHANIVRLLDVGEEDGVPFLVMDRVVGCDLRGLGEATTRVARPIPLEVGVGIVLQVLEGLRYAHRLLDAAGQCAVLVHRGVSPSNVLVSIDGVASVTDFSLPRAEAALLDDLTEEPQPNKLAYMAPEVLLDEGVDERADIYSVGVLLYELTLGQRLLRGLDFRTILRSLAQPVAPPTFLRSGYPADLELIVMRALERYPEDRQASAEVMLEDLERFVENAGLRVTRMRVARFVADVIGLPPALSADLSSDDERVRVEEALLGSEEDELDFDASGASEEDELDFDAPLEGPVAGRDEVSVAGRDEGPVAGRDVTEDASISFAGEAPSPLRDENGGATASSESATAVRLGLPRPLENTVMVTDDLVEEEEDIEASEAEILMAPKGFLDQMRARTAAQQRRSWTEGAQGGDAVASPVSSGEEGENSDDRGEEQHNISGASDATGEDGPAPTPAPGDLKGGVEVLRETSSTSGPSHETDPQDAGKDLSRPSSRLDALALADGSPRSIDRLEATDGSSPERVRTEQEVVQEDDGEKKDGAGLLAPDDPLTLIATDIAALDEDLPAAPAVSLSAFSEGGDETASSGAGSGRPENEAEDLLAGTGGLESGPEELTEGGGGPEVDGEDLTGREGILSKITLPERSRESETRQGKGVDVVDSGEVAAVLEDLAALGATEEESARSAKPKGGEGPFVDLLAEEGPPRRERTLEINEDDFLEEDDAGGEEEDLQLSRPVPPPMPKAATGNGKGPDVTGDG